MSTLKENYIKEIVPQLTKTFNFTNLLQVPKLEKIVLNMGLGIAVTNPKIVDLAAAELALIAGQKPIITRAKKPIANFKLRADLPIGCKVTLRREKMYDFFDRLVSIALPRVRDFRGMNPRSFDGLGNYSMGFNEQIIFPEIDYDKIDKLRGLDIAITTTAKTDEEGKALLEAFNFPFKKK